MLKRFTFLFSVLALLGFHLELAAYPLVYLTEETTWYEEGADVSVTVALSESSYLDVIVPFVIDASSTATIKLEANEEENDFYILTSDDEALGYIFDPATASGYLIFSPGQTEKSLDIDVDNDLDIEENETIVFRILPDEVTVARPLEPLQQTIHILDNDAEDPDAPGDKRVELTLQEQEVKEGNSLTISIAIDSDVDEEVEIYYKLEFESADAQDIDLEKTANINKDDYTGSIKHDGGGGRESFTLVTAKDQDVEAEEEVLYFTLTSAIGASGTNYPIGIKQSRITIVDNDPTTISWDLIDDEENHISLTEGLSGENFFQVSFTLSGPVSGDVEVPITVGGSAVMGDRKDTAPFTTDFYLSEELPITLKEGETTGVITVSAQNDDQVEDLENIILTLGAPLIDGAASTIAIEGPESFYLDVIDNDPVSLGFARLNPAYDAEDEDSEEPYLIPGSEQIVAERDGTVVIPINLSGSVPAKVTFDLTLDVAGSTATSFDPNADDADAHWDFQMSQGRTVWTPEKPTHEVTISAGSSALSLSILLNDDEEPLYVLGEPVPDGIEEDETIRITISNIQTEAQNVSLGEETSFTVTIKELPDIDVTSLFSTLSVDQSKWINGQPKLNQTTGLFEINLDAVPPATVDADLTGYQSYKVVFNLNQYDINDPDNPDNDPLTTNPPAPGLNEAFEYYVRNPFVLRFPNGSERIVLKEGTEQSRPSKFTEENADIVEYANYLLRPLDFPSLEPQYDEEVEQRIYGAEEPFHWTLDFKSRGVATFPVDRFDSSKTIRVYLTAEPTTVVPFNGISGLPIIGLDNLDDGSVRLEIDTSGTSAIQIQYIGEDGIWRIAHPSVISAGSSRFFWIDRGPPATLEHPANVDFRVYRVMANQ